MSEQEKPFDVVEALNEFDGGVFMQRVAKAVADTALHTVNQGDNKPRKGKVTITLDMDRISDSNQVAVSHDVKFEYPTHKGKRTENHTTSTPMHVNNRGHISVFPEQQINMFGKKDGEPTE